MTAIPQKEVLRYLGARGGGDAALLAQVAEISKLFERRVVPHSVYQVFDCTVEGDTVLFADRALKSAALATHLKGCRRLLLFAATLGTEADRIARTERTRALVRGAAAHAAGAAMIEQYCDDLQETLAQAYEGEGLYLRPRFSPGYGDLPLSTQQTFFELLDLNRRLGMSLTPDYMMIPSKSVTAVIGFSTEPTKSFHRCSSCGSADCPFKRESDTNETIS